MKKFLSGKYLLTLEVNLSTFAGTYTEIICYMERRTFLAYLGLGSTAFLAPSCAFTKLHRQSEYDDCEQAWIKLIAPAEAVGPYAYVHPEKNVPNVLIYGDSISIAYTETVRQELEGKASVFRIYKNGHSSNEFIPYMKNLKETMFQPYLSQGWKFRWDLIHFNFGLHDLKYTLNGDLRGTYSVDQGKPVTSPVQYAENLHLICRYLQSEYPGTKLIFATTTPVPFDSRGRIEGDAKKYNQVAKEVLADYRDIRVNDLYRYTFPKFEEWCLKPGNVHYNETGTISQGKQVANVISDALF
jgi:hypothetical protein